MPRWQRREHTGRTLENCKTHSDGIPCPTCKSTDTRFRFLNNKKKTQPRYYCFKCKKLWTAGGKTRAPYNKRGGAASNPVVADTTSQPPSTAAVSNPVVADTTSQPPSTAAVSNPVVADTTSQPPSTAVVSNPVVADTTSQPPTTVTVR